MSALPAFRESEQSPEPRAALLYVPTGPGTRLPVLERLARVGVPMTAATDTSHALRLLAARPPTLALVDLAGDRATLAAIRAIRTKYPNVSVAAVVDPSNPLISGEAIHAGVLDPIPWPFEDRDVLTVLSNARDLVAMDPVDRSEALTGAAEGLVAQSLSMRSVLERVRAAARGRAGLFVSGEPGTGRTLVARVVHQIGCGAHDHDQTPFLVENCANSTPDEVERRLFGVVLEGRKNGGRSAAFDRIGRSGALYQARGGTLCLRNLLEAPARVQARLVRLLRDREAELADQAGTLVDLDVRVVGCVDPSVDEAVSDGRMRLDLYERLAQVRVDVPPLRRRREDIPVLAVLFLKRACVEQGVAMTGISRSALRLLAALPWSGNATELLTLMSTLVQSIDRPVIQLDDVLEHASFEGAAVRMDAGVSLREAKARFERECISAVLARHQGRIGDAAKALGIQRTNLYRKVRQLQVARPRPLRRTDR